MFAISKYTYKKKSIKLKSIEFNKLAIGYFLVSIHPS